MHLAKIIYYCRNYRGLNRYSGQVAFDIVEDAIQHIR
jgi:hypothetical protein